jgi:uncharacterized membrane protein
MTISRSDRARSVARVVLGGGLIIAGIGHLTFARKDFQAQVPDWVGIDKNMVVVLSGLVEISLGVAASQWVSSSSPCSRATSASSSTVTMRSA